ncbi:MAG: hypothetical protein II141_01370, partial [Clostridia bacterium]|nr:hypothetical protein [Clostridia bacterium]
KILNRPASVMIGPNSGLAGIAYWLNDHYQLKDADALNKQSPLVVTLKEWVDEQFADGRVASLSPNEIETKVAELTGGKFGKLDE